MTGHADVWAAPALTIGALAIGVYVVALLEAVVRTTVAGAPIRTAAFGEPIRRGALLLAQQGPATERPDAAAWTVAPALYVALAAAGLTVVPWSRSFSIADVDAGIVLWGTVEALVIVAIFLHGWSANSHQPLLAGYRFLAAGVSYVLLSMFVLIAVAIPAESLALSDIVASQHHVWNVVRQPLGLPLFAIVVLGSSTWGPLDVAGGNDLAGGTTADVSGPALLLWHAARAAMLTSSAAIAATMFLGGWQGPFAAGPVWVVAKTAAVLAAFVAAGHLLARVRVERFVVLSWTVLLPIAFADLVIAGLEGLR